MFNDFISSYLKHHLKVMKKITSKEKNLTNESKSNLKSKVYTEYVFRVKYLNIATRVFLIRSRHGGPDKIISSSLPFIHNIRKEVDK